MILSDLPRLVIAATNSGAGKTTITLGIMAALKKRGLNVQGFKCGPDYIDPGYHTALTRRQSRNLDSWFVNPSLLKKIFINNAFDADISIIEGVMGLYDGRNPSNNHGSTAEISQIIQSPVILVLDARSMARSSAAIIKGFQVFSKKNNIAAVIANKVGSKNHLAIIREAIEKECNVPVIGGILRDEKLHVPERHLGLLPAVERGELNSLFENLSDVVKNSIDLDRLLKIAGFTKKNNKSNEISNIKNASIFKKQYLKQKHDNESNIKVAVARDAAFNFYYPENLEVLQQAGMELQYFSPLKNEPLPEGVTGLYLGGGFPEEFAKTLSKNRVTKKSIHDAIEHGMPVIAECGGFMYLTEEIIDKKSKAYSMLGILPGRVIMQNRLAALGYREISGLENNFLLGESELMRGHEFHYSVYESAGDREVENIRLRDTGAQSNYTNYAPAYRMKGRNVDCESGLIYKNLIAGYAHFYFLSNPKVVIRWAKKCLEYKSLTENFRGVAEKPKASLRRGVGI